MELDALPQETRERIEELGTADLVIGVPPASGEALARAADAVRQALAARGRTVLIHPGGPFAENDPAMGFLPVPLDGPERLGPTTAYRTLFLLAQKFGARMCAVLDAETERLTAGWVAALTQPVLDSGFDLVMPVHARHKFDGLLNKGVLYPLTRALYGKRVRCLNGRDCAFSSRLVDRFLQPDVWQTLASRTGPPVWLFTQAVCAGFQVGEAHVGPRQYPTPESSDLSSVIAPILGSLFIDMERNASFWQKVRGSQPVQTFGTPFALTGDGAASDVRRMVEAFRFGFQNLQDVWGLVLPPATLFELKKLTRVGPEQFRMPDEVWVRLVYDFALGHRQRVISRDHLLRSLTPAYLAWVASFVLEMHEASAAEAEERLEALCRVFEVQKPYLLSRWRWPDRFNP